jgi:hypothetical protein
VWAEAALVRTLPSLGSKGNAFGGAIASFVIAVIIIGIDVIIDAVTGANLKAKLVNVIRNLLSVRAECWLVSERMKLIETSIEAQIKSLEDLRGLTYTREQLERALSSRTAKLREELLRLTNLDKAYAPLVMHDQLKQSYTAEDVEVPEGKISFELGGHTAMCMDLWNNGHENEAEIKLYHANSLKNQAWNVDYVNQLKCYTIKSNESGKYLAVHHAARTPGSLIVQYDYNTGDNQMWWFAAASYGRFFIVSSATGFVIGSEDLHRLANGGRLTQQHAEAEILQIWSFRPSA